MRTDRYQEERRARITTLLQQHERMAVDELARHFKVTGATIRSDLTALMHAGKVIRTLGSAMIVRQPPVSPLAERLRIEADRKRSIGRAAAALINDRDVIALDASSTSLALAPYLYGHADLTVVTNCLAVASEFVQHRNVSVLMPGGHLDHDSASLVGMETIDSLKNIRVQTAFVGARSISLDTGLCDSDPATMEFKKALMRISRRVIALVDSSKWEAVSLIRFAEFSQIHALVSDSGIPPGIVKELQKRGVKVVIG